MERRWRVDAADLRARSKRREYVEATGWSEAEARRDLAGLLREWNVEASHRLGWRGRTKKRDRDPDR